MAAPGGGVQGVEGDGLSRPPRVRSLRPEESYARKVLSGTIPACSSIQAACRRHLDDLAHAEERGWFFDDVSADLVLKWIPRFLYHWKGRWGRRTKKHPHGQPFELEPWQQFIVGSVFGWRMRETDPESGIQPRRFRLAVVWVPRKNGKSALAAAMGLYANFYDPDAEPASEGYVAATKMRQAYVLHEYVEQMAANSPVLRKELKTIKTTHRVARLSDASRIECLGEDSEKQDGFSPAVAMLDEIHAWKSSAPYDRLNSGTGARAQPLMIMTSTAGQYRPESFGYQMYQRAMRACENDSDPHTFAFVAQLDESDAWDDLEALKRCNPNFGISVSQKDLEQKIIEAKADPAKLTEFLIKHGNRWVGALSGWLQTELGGTQRWDLGNGPLPDLAGRECYAGIDLAQVNDLSALALFFPRITGEKRDYTKLWYWCPEEDIERRAKNDQVPYSKWRAEGRLIATEGNRTDHGAIRVELNRLRERYRIRRIAFDPHFATHLVNELADDGFEMLEIRGTAATMHAPTSELGRLVVAGELAHGDDPILRWMMINTIVRRTVEGLGRPDKSRSPERIDGVTALILSIQAKMSEPEFYYGSGAN